MSEPKPFAEFSGNCMSIPEADYEVYPSMPRSAAAINAAVTARERKAAAKALRDLAASVRAETGVRAPKPSDPFWRDHFAAMADREADAIEKGER